MAESRPFSREGWLEAVQQGDGPCLGQGVLGQMASALPEGQIGGYHQHRPQGELGWGLMVAKPGSLEECMETSYALSTCW